MTRDSLTENRIRFIRISYTHTRTHTHTHTHTYIHTHIHSHGLILVNTHFDSSQFQMNEWYFVFWFFYVDTEMLTHTDKYTDTHTVTHKFAHVPIHTNLWKDRETHTDVHTHFSAHPYNRYMHVITHTNLHTLYVYVQIYKIGNWV